ncbi:hypothetical protein [Methylocella silvestris]|uniref:hypothetical protein n=1 Tax=Methylocella silvestris TaxID=199596 RepID=UPI00031812D4|nr:hypothetical protein [Methylocella silvestris]
MECRRGPLSGLWGVEYAVADKSSGHAEYRYIEFGHTRLYSTVFGDDVVFAPYAKPPFHPELRSVCFSHNFDTFGPAAVAKY